MRRPRSKWNNLVPITTKNPIKSLYVHIPFCTHLCHYCDFAKMLYEPDRADRYLERLFFELDQYRMDTLDTLYVGGGTPTALTAPQLERLLKKLNPLLGPHAEFTVEANVENATEEKLALMRRCGVNRLSLGVQTMNRDHLKRMNRFHQPDDVARVVTLARSLGFLNVNLDLIYDLPGQTDDELRRDVDQMVLLDVPHIATYSLTIHPQTVFGIQKIVPADDETSRRHYDIILEKLRAAGYERYEVSNFAKPGYQGRHNLNYWTNGYFVGIGLGASGYLPGRRYKNTLNLSKYLEGTTVEDIDAIDIRTQEIDFLMLGLRLAQGFETQTYEKMFSFAFGQRYQNAILHLSEAGLLQTDGKRWYATDEGLMLLDHVVLTLIKEFD